MLEIESSIHSIQCTTIHIQWKCDDKTRKLDSLSTQHRQSIHRRHRRRRRSRSQSAQANKMLFEYQNDAKV